MSPDSNCHGYQNDYQQAIKSVCDILSHYDTDNLYPAFGFGAKFRDGSVQHCFALNGCPKNPECAGVDGIMQAYQSALRNVSLHGPTLFSPVIATACHYAATENTQEHQHYEILLIVTDGIISDMEATIAQIVAGSNMPLSIIIVGVGNADFSDMSILDADDTPLQSSGVYMKRDICQFVKINDFRGNTAALSKAILEEVPSQFMSYFNSTDIVPNQPPPARQGSMRSRQDSILQKE
jgi:hypothetical protein